MVQLYRKITLQVQSVEDPSKWNTVHSYSHENRLVASGEWTHDKLKRYAVDNMARWRHNSAMFDGRKMRVYVEGEGEITPFVLAGISREKPTGIKVAKKKASGGRR